MQRLIHVLSMQRRRFSYARKTKRRNTRKGRKTDLETRFQMSNKNLIGRQNMEFSISFDSSWARAFSYPMVMSLSTSRVRWNRSSTASLEGEWSNEGCRNKNLTETELCELKRINRKLLIWQSQLSVGEPRVRWNWLSTASLEGDD